MEIQGISCNHLKMKKICEGSKRLAQVVQQDYGVSMLRGTCLDKALSNLL